MCSESPASPLEAYEEAALNAAFSQLLEEECEQLLAQEPAEEDARLLEQLEERLPQQLQRIDKVIHRKGQLQRVWVGTRTFLRTAAAILAIVFVGLGTAVAANDPFRMRLINFLTNATTEYIAMGFIANPTAPEIPEGWLAKYYPAYLPEGYELAEARSVPHSSSAIFTRDGDSIFFRSYSTADAAQINARAAETRNIRIHDQKALLVILNNEYTVVWAEDDAYFAVTSTSRQMSIDIAESVSPIPN